MTEKDMSEDTPASLLKPTQPTARFQSVKFEDGVIGKLERFLQARFGIGKMYSRAIATCVFSVCLHNVHVMDKMGPVHPAVFAIDIGASGLGVKTPPLRVARKIVEEFNLDYLKTGKFTPQGLREWIAPDITIPNKDGTMKKPHKTFLLLRDEASTLFGEQADYMKDLYEDLSEIWDGFLQGYSTRGFGDEGNTEVYGSLLAAGSPKILAGLDPMFFVQGLGNRVLWVFEDAVFKPFPPDFFFGSAQDSELETLIQETVSHMRELENACESATIWKPDAWLIWANTLRESFTKPGDDAMKEYQSKAILNTLRLAANYAASRFSVTNSGDVAVSEADLAMAIDDMKVFVQMWQKVVTESKRQRAGDFGRIKQRKVDIRAVLSVGVRLGMFTKSQLKEELDTTDNVAVRETINTLLEDGRLACLTEVDDEGKVTKGRVPAEVWKEFRKGHEPAVYEVQEKGKAWLEANLF